ncbi:MAG: DUF389 domain-containing protein [Gemmatimonadales bacterium]|nr:MAG: DUF389 domain-containing protein [Gemmatimonadales bacterium]
MNRSWTTSRRPSGRRTGTVVFLPVEATVPRLEDDPAEEAPADAVSAGAGAIQPRRRSRRIGARINREELYASVAKGSQATGYYVVMVTLSVIVACSGLMLDDVAVIIGAMVIAPLIGPSMGIALATALGDLKLGRSALLASMGGVAVAFSISALAGLVVIALP